MTEIVILDLIKDLSLMMLGFPENATIYGAATHTGGQSNSFEGPFLIFTVSIIIVFCL